MADRLRAWAPALAWAALIFYASTDAFSAQNTGRFLAPVFQWLVPGLSSAELELMNAIARKCAHFVEYCILYVLGYRAISVGHAQWRASHALGAWLVVAAYAGLDEFHQAFVASRTASPWDSLLDVAGGTFGMLACAFALRFRRLRGSSAAHGDARQVR